MLRRLRAWFRSLPSLEDLSLTKSFVMMGEAAFGPPCRVCGQRRVDLMPARYRDLIDHPLACQC